MGNLVIATVFIAMVNILMWFSSVSMLSMNPSGTFCYNVEGSIIDSSVLHSGNYTVLNNDDLLKDLPSSQTTSVTAGSTNIFTDIFNNVIGWFKSAPGIKYIYGVIAAPYNILKCTGLPDIFVTGLGTVWYLITFLVFVAFIWGRND